MNGAPSQGNALRVAPLVLGPGEDLPHRATAQVGRHRVDLQSSHALAASAEAMPSAFLLPAMARGADLRIEEAVCGDWRANIDTVRELAARWWDFSGGAVVAPATRTLAARPGTALFFGGGVDSLYSLTQRSDQIDALVYVRGFDVVLADPERLRRVDAWNRRVAEAAGKDLITVRTDLRTVPEFRLAAWEIAHGGALAAVAHLLAAHAGHFIVPSSQPTWVEIPWGSNADLDPAWSSAAVRLECHGSDRDRFAKVAAIAEQPLAHEFLRVCWQNRGDDPNCGVCEKCVRTQLEFVAAGTFGRLRTFPPGNLAERIDALPGVTALIERNYREIVDRLDDAGLRDSVNSLIARSGAWQRRQRWRGRLVDAARFLRWRFR